MWKSFSFFKLLFHFNFSSHSRMLFLCAGKRNTFSSSYTHLMRTCTNGSTERAPESKQVIEFWINNVSKMESTLFCFKTLFLSFFSAPLFTFQISIQIFRLSSCFTRRFPFLASRIWRFIIHTFNFARNKNEVNKYKSSSGTGCEEFIRNDKKWCDSCHTKSDKRVNCKW